MDVKKQYEKWLRHVDDAELMAELESIEDDEKAVEDRFFRELAFGTGGLRGVIGAGDNRMNVYTVKKATQGLCDYLSGKYASPSAAVSYDSRRHSDVFARAAAEVFAANGVRVYIFSELMPTPFLSFAVRELNCSAGIAVTASHNPAKYNGYKVYGGDGCQITLEAANEIIGHIRKTDTFFGVKTVDFEGAVQKGTVSFIEKNVITRYYEEVLQCSVYGETAQAGLRAVYTPLNGTGNKPVRRILDAIGIKDVAIVQEQELPDPDFSTCPFPNPEEKEALALGLELMKEKDADLLLATDPDCDRVGTAVKHNGEYVLVNGNQMGVLLFDFICKMRIQNGTMPKRPFAVKTIVTTEMAQAVADRYGVELCNVLTGFKFIGEQIGLLEQKGEEQRYVFGFKESYGYLSGAYVRDKDAVNASMLICEMAAYYKREGKSLIDALGEMYRAYGYYYDRLESRAYEGAAGMERMKVIMERIRKNPPGQIGGRKVAAVQDYLAQKEYSGGELKPLGLPASDVIGFQLEGGSSVVVRPSGTEPKLKVYYSLKCVGEEESAALFSAVEGDMGVLLK